MIKTEEIINDERSRDDKGRGGGENRAAGHEWRRKRGSKQQQLERSGINGRRHGSIMRIWVERTEAGGAERGVEDGQEQDHGRRIGEGRGKRKRGKNKEIKLIPNSILLGIFV